jgi:polyketide cyclase/dehydrase/lipid transport protein
MVRLQSSEIINRPSADVFRFVATEHFENHPTWDPSIVEMEQTSTAPMDVGTTGRLVRLDRGKRVEGTVEIIEYEPDRCFAALVSFGPFVLHQQVLIEPDGPDSSRLILVIDSRATGVMRAMLPLLRGTFRRTMTESLQRIKEMVE